MNEMSKMLAAPSTTKFTEFRVGLARTINLGNYESIRIEAGVAVELADGDDMPRARADAQEELRRLLEETYLAQHKGKKLQHSPPPQQTTPAQSPADPKSQPSFAPAKPVEEPLEY